MEVRKKVNTTTISLAPESECLNCILEEPVSLGLDVGEDSLYKPPTLVSCVSPMSYKSIKTSQLKSLPEYGGFQLSAESKFTFALVPSLIG